MNGMEFPTYSTKIEISDLSVRDGTVLGIELHRRDVVEFYACFLGMLYLLLKLGLCCSSILKAGYRVHIYWHAGRVIVSRL